MRLVKVINQELFAIMVIMAIVTTFMTTPIVMWLYSPARDMPSYLRRSIIDSGGVEDQLRLLICTTASWNIQAMINFVEITRGKERKSLRPFVLHLMEYTERLSSIRMASFSRRESKKYWQEVMSRALAHVFCKCPDSITESVPRIFEILKGSFPPRP
jgi:hypothetical protein